MTMPNNKIKHKLSTIVLSLREHENGENRGKKGVKPAAIWLQRYNVKT